MKIHFGLILVLAVSCQSQEHAADQTGARRECEACAGTGLCAQCDDYAKCLVCAGSHDCPQCNASGKTGGTSCAMCEGTKECINCSLMGVVYNCRHCGTTSECQECKGAGTASG